MEIKSYLGDRIMFRFYMIGWLSLRWKESVTGCIHIYNILYLMLILCSQLRRNIFLNKYLS